MEWKLDRSSYILRYHMPCTPTYDVETFNRRHEELIEYCVENKIEAVMVYVDLNPHWYHMPDSLEHTKYYKDIFEPFIDKIRKNGISYQLNYQNILGAWDGGDDLTDVNGWENWVDEKGYESQGVGCCIGKKFREIAGAKLRLWSETKPDVLWIDDDIRFHNHMPAVRDVWAGKAGGRMDFGCFCDNHMALFNKEYNTNLSREELVDGILAGGELREKWMEFSGRVASEFASWIEQTVHSVSPETRVGVMTSLPDAHNAEGRDWKGFLKSLSGDLKPILRPHFGPYQESSPHGFYGAYLYFDQLKTDIKESYGNTEMDFCPEIENTRFTRWAKSFAATKYQMMLSGFVGCLGTTFSIYDLDGCVLSEQPEVADMLNEMRPVLNKLEEYDFWNWESEGVAFVTVPGGLKKSQLSVKQMDNLCPMRRWDSLVLKAGIPCKYVTPSNFDSVKGLVLDQYSVDLLSDDEILKLLSKNILINGGAAKRLEERGFSKYLGVTIGEQGGATTSYEIIDIYSHNDESPVRIPLRIDGHRWNKLTLCGAKKISTVYTPSGKDYPGFTYFENELGGKVYTYTANGEIGVGFFSTWSIKLFKKICSDISENTIVKADNFSYCSVVSKTNGKERAVMFTNMTADTVECVEIENPTLVKEALIITQNGECIKPEISGNIVKCKNVNLNLYGSAVCIVK